MTTSTAVDPARPETSRRPSRRRRPATTDQILAVGAICLVGAVTAIATSDAAPTGTDWIDAVYRAALVAATAVAGARARRWSLAVAAGLVTLGSGGWWGVAGLAALGVTFALAWDDRRSRIAGAAAGALIGVVALHLGWPDATFATAVLAAAALLPVWLSGYRTSSRRVRRRVRWALFGVAVFAVVGLAAAVVFAVTQRSEVQRAIDEALTAADGVGAARTDAATAGFASARERLDRVVAASDAPWMVPARALPVVGVNLHSVREAAAAGSHLADSARRLSGRVDYDALRLPGGGIDMAVLSTYRAPLRTAEAALTESVTALRAADSPWVVGPVADRMGSLAGRVERARNDAVTARLGVETAPALLGVDAPRRYLLLLGNPAEARDIGGHLGNWAEITAVDGRIDVVRVGRPYDLFGPASERSPFLPDPTTYPRSLIEMNPTEFPQNWGATPDLPTVARLAAELYPQAAGGAPIDGVLYADPDALAAALEITGPVTVPGGDRVLDAAGAVEFLEKGQFSAYNGSTGDRVVTDLVQEALTRLLEGQLPSPATVAKRFGPVADAGHLGFVSLHEGDQAFLGRLGVRRAVAAEPGTDLLAVISRNDDPSKVDAYLTRRIDHRVTWDPDTGKASAQVVVTLTNGAPASGLPAVVGNPPPGAAPGTNRTELSVLTPFRATGARVDGASAAIGSRTDVDGLQRHTLVVDLAPGQTRTVVFDLTGRVDGPTYRFRWIGQPLANPDDARLVIRSTGEPFAGGAASGTVTLPEGDHDITLRTAGS